MSKEDKNDEPNRLIENPMLHQLSKIEGNFIENLIYNYYSTWEKSGIHLSRTETEQKIQRFHPDNTYVLQGSNSDRIVAQIHTVSIQVSSLNNLVDMFPTYASVERAAQKPPDEKANTMICFSLNCLPGYRIQLDHHTQSTAQTIIKMLPKTLRKFAYSYMNVPDEFATSRQLAQHYHQYLREGTQHTGGPVFMHEYFGGLTVAFLEQSRIEHLRAAGGNILVVYPTSPDEAEKFKKAKDSRSYTNPIEQTPFLTYYRDAVLYRDISIKYS